MRGSGTIRAYTLLLRNLVPVYRALEDGLDRHRSNPMIGSEIARSEVYRSRALETDLAGIAGNEWADKLPQLPGGEAYAQRIAEATCGDGSLLLAHAYVRYLGDLSGGQILRRLLMKSLKLPPEFLTFYDFPEIADILGYKADYRAALDRAPVADAAQVADEAAEAFRLNIALSEEIARADHSVAGAPIERSH